MDSPPLGSRARPGYYDDLEFRPRPGGGAPSFDDLSGTGLIPVHTDRLLAAPSSAHHIHHHHDSLPGAGAGWDYPLVGGKASIAGGSGPSGAGASYAGGAGLSVSQQGLYQQAPQASMYGLSASAGSAYDLASAASAQQLGYGAGAAGSAGSGATAASYMAYYYPRT